MKEINDRILGHFGKSFRLPFEIYFCSLLSFKHNLIVVSLYFPKTRASNFAIIKSQRTQLQVFKILISIVPKHTELSNVIYQISSSERGILHNRT